MKTPKIGKAMYLTTMIPTRTEGFSPERFSPFRRFAPTNKVIAGMHASPSMDAESSTTRKGASSPTNIFLKGGTTPIISPTIDPNVGGANRIFKLSLFTNVLNGLVICFSFDTVSVLNEVTRSLVCATVTSGVLEWFSRSASVADTGPTVGPSTLFTLKFRHEYTRIIWYTKVQM
ncbi:hypothetical protein V8G54_030167 [Vigna mungo]|uniref:Uncharacterized protein n=1 Tax=Vigna mungo TaxID=3915 RepID=A0AAQ3MVU3_VIGMU